MEAAFAKAGITDFDLAVDGIRFGADEATIKVKAKLKGVTTTTDRVFERKVAEYGLKLVGQKGEQLVGYKSSRPKYPFSYKTVCGAQYKCTVDQAKAIFG
jgi:hypothetical protein